MTLDGDPGSRGWIALEEMLSSRNRGEMKRKGLRITSRETTIQPKEEKRGAGMVLKTHKLKKKPAMGQVKWKLTCTALSLTGTTSHQQFFPCQRIEVQKAREGWWRARQAQTPSRGTAKDLKWCEHSHKSYWNDRGQAWLAYA